MDDLAELRDIMGMDDSSAPAPEPDDTATPEPSDETPPDDDADATPPEDLSAEERVAALMEAELAASGVEPAETEAEDEPDEEDEAAPEESDEDLEALLAEGRAARAQRQQQEQLQPYLHVYAAAEQRIAEGRAHYERERERIEAAVWADAERTVDPTAYVRMHLRAALAGVTRAEEAWTAQIGQDARNQVQAIREQQSLPAWANHLVTTRRLPQAAVERILQTTTDPRAMPAVADLLVEARNALASERRKATQATRSAAARTIAANQVHPNATGRAPAARTPELKGDQAELLAILNMK